MAIRSASVLSFHDLAVGDEWIGAARTVTESDVVAFAGLSGDFNPIHVDHESARATPFGRPVAHGLLGLAMASGLASHAPRVDTLALIAVVDWSFREPIFFGDTIRVHTRVLALEERSRGRRGVVTWRRTLTNQHGVVVQEGTTQTLVQGAAGRLGSSSTTHSPIADDASPVTPTP